MGIPELKYTVQLRKGEKDQLRIPESHAPVLKAVFDYAHENRHGYIEVLIRPMKKSRTNPQNNYLHRLCGLIASETGHTKEEVKEQIKRKLHEVYVDNKPLWPSVTDENGDEVLSPLDGRPIMVSSADVESRNAVFFIDKALEICSFLDIRVPPRPDGKR
jgi:hypothetical protein